MDASPFSEVVYNAHSPGGTSCEVDGPLVLGWKTFSVIHTGSLSVYYCEGAVRLWDVYGTRMRPPKNKTIYSVTLLTAVERPKVQTFSTLSATKL